MIANLPNSAQLEGSLTIPPRYIRVLAVLWARGEGQTRVTNIHFASSMTCAKCIQSEALG